MWPAISWRLLWYGRTISSPHLSGTLSVFGLPPFTTRGIGSCLPARVPTFECHFKSPQQRRQDHRRIDHITDMLGPVGAAHTLKVAYTCQRGLADRPTDRVRINLCRSHLLRSRAPYMLRSHVTHYPSSRRPPLHCWRRRKRLLEIISFRNARAARSRMLRGACCV